jgi:hypothetical protein
MNEQSESIWGRPRKGLGALLFWALIVSVAAFLFAAALITILYYFAPALLFAWADGYGCWAWQTPGVVPALIGLRVMALFVGAVATVFAIRYVVRRFFVHRTYSSSAQDASATPQTTRYSDYFSAK